ncbi:kynureninase [Salipiger aestuarii]|uniref:Kynureninase n=1 Tax=Salipiger aestuarii TaxID=568098 RepID=A0A327YQV9_9RHOB|nr:kynureninase [Salipiger aestuarii]EIE49180.1 kynureninase [Citreicella sp. 357]KAA8609706.1 kynureninase [Salipiger aestuarii]KAA8614038.1 kynureninase [Salipiger aestuarii]KAB2543666.1 kynureninase [Salipiger aestuarii]RAK22902.1 kynureninase [Salipiger aestuarii]
MTDFAWTRDQFHVPLGLIYLDGNSLGPMPKATPARIERLLTEEWGERLVTGWNACGWMDMPRRLGDRLGRLIGAEHGHVVIGDTLSIKVFQALSAALQIVPERRTILSDRGNFPSDLYMAEGLIHLLGDRHDLRLVPPHDLEDAITEEVGVVLVTEIDYRTGRRHNLKALTRKAHDMGAVVIWDLAHSAGALPVDVAAGGADFAVGCTYKYINAGPGAPAFIYVSPEHIDHVEPALCGWLGHDKPFSFEPGYRPATGIERMRVGTPPVLQMAALDAALDVWDRVDMADLRKRSLDLGGLMIEEIETHCPGLKLATPRENESRGSQVSFRSEHGYAIMQALIDLGVIGDFRAPDILRFGITPLYIGEAEIREAVEVLARILRGALWDHPKYHRRKSVT